MEGENEMSINGCSPHQAKFAYNYVILGGNKLKAIEYTFNINGYPNKKFKTRHSAELCALRYLKNDMVKDLVSKLEEKIHGSKEEVVEKAQQILKELDIVSFFDPRKMFEDGTDERRMLDRLGDDARAVQRIKIKKTYFKDDDSSQRDEEIETDIWICDKMKALTKYGEHFKLYSQVMRHEGEIKHPVIWGMPDNGTREDVGA